MAIDFKERNVSGILYNLNAFWSSSLMEDRHVIDQLWRGYHNVLDNLYTQLYQLNYSKAIDSITPNWISHWERFDFTNENAVDTFNDLYPYAYYLPSNVKTVYLLRESPREISILPALTMLLNNGTVILPDGSPRLPGDTIYPFIEDRIDIDFPCIVCNFTGELNEETCPVCLGEKKVSGMTSRHGMAVDTVKYYKRADDINDYDEGITPLGDFVVDELNGIIAFKSQPYETLWSEQVIRNTEIIYDNFGSLLQFYKPDSYKYLRQTQGLWYAYWNGSTISNIEIGLNVVTDLPFILDAGYVQDIRFIKNEFVTERVFENLLSQRHPLPALPYFDAETNTYRILLEIQGAENYTLTEGIDYEIIYDYEDSEDYLDWYSFADFNSINAIPAVEKKAYIKFFDTESTRQIADKKLSIYFEDGSGSYIITVAGRDYIIPDTYTPEIVVNQYLEKYTPLTDAINVYDYINFPRWWEYMLGYTQEGSYFKKFGRIFFDSGVPADSKINLDSFHKHYAKAGLFYYHTFLVSLEQDAVPHSVEDVRIIRAFLDTIKPSYSHYIIRAVLDFNDNCETRETHFGLSLTINTQSDQGPMQRNDDSWIKKKLDINHALDAHDRYEKFFVAKLPLDGIRFISEIAIHSCCADSLEGRKLDSGRMLDSYSKYESLVVTKEI